MNENIWLELAMNDDNGNDTDKLLAIAIHALDLHIICTGRPCVVRRGKNLIKIGRYSHITYKQATWVGNMAWNAVLVGWYDAQDILEYLRGSGKYSIESADDEFWQRWENGDPISLLKESNA